MLLGNYSPYTRGPLKYLAGAITAGESYAKTYGNASPPGWARMCFQDGSNESLPHIGYPSGYGGSSWKMPLGLNTSLSVKYGLMSGQTAVITITPTGTGVRARPGTGSATLTITANGTAGLVMMGEGVATITLDALGEIVAQLAAEGASTITIAASGDALTALGWPEGTSTITISAGADPMAVGFMEGTTDFTVELTPEAVAAAVWSALAAQYNEESTMGQKINAAGTAGDPWTALLEDYTDAAQFGAFVKKLLTTAKFIGLK